MELYYAMIFLILYIIYYINLSMDKILFIGILNNNYYWKKAIIWIVLLLNEKYDKMIYIKYNKRGGIIENRHGIWCT